MKIQRKGEVVEGVYICAGSSPQWSKEGDGRLTLFAKNDGWEEVKELTWVDVTGECIVKETSGVSHNGYVVYWPPNNKQFRTKKVMRYDLPEDWVALWQVGECLDPNEWIKRFLKPCLIVEKEDS